MKRRCRPCEATRAQMREHAENGELLKAAHVALKGAGMMLGLKPKGDEHVVDGTGEKSPD